jgi:hypothetical protein
MIDISNAVSKHKAIAIAQRWLDKNANPDIDCIVDSDRIMERRHVYVVFFQSDKFLLSGDFSDSLLGNNPFVINRYTGEIIARLGSVGFWETLEMTESNLHKEYFPEK